jgi:uncharacterized phage protein (TIGR02218 family)
MQNISDPLKQHLAQEVTTLATCWKIMRKDGLVLGFTDHDSDIMYNAITYLAATAMGATAVTSALGLSVDNLEIEGMLSNDAIAENDILAGLYDYAQIDVFQVNYTDLSQTSLSLKTGWLGEITLRAGQFVGEVRGLSVHLQTTLGEVYTPSCRASFGDARCKFDISTLTVNGQVSAFADTIKITDTSRSENDGHFDYGIITFQSGLNTGISREIKRYQLQAFTLNEPLPFAVTAGDNYVAIAGCDKRFDTCVNRYNNALNFRGEPHVPGTDKLLKTSATR